MPRNSSVLLSCLLSAAVIWRQSAGSLCRNASRELLDTDLNSQRSLRRESMGVARRALQGHIHRGEPLLHRGECQWRCAGALRGTHFSNACPLWQLDRSH
jgi:hypothetical protein